jgi:ribosome-binding factor A
VKPDRLARVNRLIQTTLAELVPQVRDPRVSAPSLLSVTGVRTSPDLRHAKVYLSIAGSTEAKSAALAGLQRASGFLRAGLGREIQLRYLPELHFELDATIESAARIEGILREIESERPPEPAAEEATGEGAPATLEGVAEEGGGER